MIPRIDEVFNVQPNVHGNGPKGQAERNPTRQFQATGMEGIMREDITIGEAVQIALKRVGFLICGT